MGKQVTLRVTPEQYEAYQAAAEKLGDSLHGWAINSLRVALRQVRLKHSADLEPEPPTDKIQQLAIRLSEDLEIDVVDAAEASRVSVTTWCILVLDTVSGASRLVEYLKRCRR